MFCNRAVYDGSHGAHTVIEYFQCGLCNRHRDRILHFIYILNTRNHVCLLVLHWATSFVTTPQSFPVPMSRQGTCPGHTGLVAKVTCHYELEGPLAQDVPETFHPHVTVTRCSRALLSPYQQ